MIDINKSKKLFFLIILIIAISSGCWDHRELDELAIATSVGTDLLEDPSLVEVSVELVIPKNIPTPGGGGGSGPPTYLLQSQGKTIFDAVRKMTLESQEKIYFAHNSVLLFSKEIAEKGLLPYLDFYTRDQELRRTPLVLVTEDNTSEIMNVSAVSLPYSGLYIEKLVEEIETNSLVGRSNLQQFLDKLISPTRSTYCSLIKIKGEGEKQTLELAETAIFKKDKMVGTFDFKEGRGLLWVVGEVKSGIITVPWEKDRDVAQWILYSKSKIIPTIENNQLKITVKITESGILGEQECSVDFTQLNNLQELEKRLEGAIKQEVIAAVEKAQELNADVFGFGEAFYRKYPTLWREQLEKDWDRFFPELEVEVLVQSKIKKTGMIYERITITNAGH